MFFEIFLGKKIDPEKFCLFSPKNMKKCNLMCRCFENNFFSTALLINAQVTNISSFMKQWLLSL